MILRKTLLGVLLCACGCGGAGSDQVTPDSALPTPDATIAGADASPDARPPPVTCVPPTSDGELQDVRGVTAAPYYVHHPAVDDPMVETIMFLPGGSGSQTSALSSWRIFLADDPSVASYRVLIPYTDGNQLIDEGQRAFKTLDAVLYCYGGDPARVHVAGFSNGGRMAFWFMLVRPDRFVTLLGAPGLFPPSQPPEWAEALGERPVFNGVGELDDEWRPSVQATHDALVVEGANSIYVEFPGEPHRPGDAFDEGVLFDFWRSH